MKIDVIFRYDVDDKEFSGDYREVLIFIDGSLVQTYDDEYHDKGEDKMTGFLDATKYFNKKEKIVLKKRNVADYDL